MKNLLHILSLLFLSGCVKSQAGYLGHNVSQPHSLIIFSSESNSGSIAPNSSALSWEIGVRDSVKILNNTTLLFESLNIGVNNLIGHAGLEAYWYISNGWELEIANAVDSGTLPNPTFTTKIGQGGSTSADWVTPGFTIYNNRFVRVDTAVKLLTQINNGIAPQLYMFYSQGANDAIANTDTAVWHTQTKTFISDFRTHYNSTMPFFFCYLPATTTNSAKFNLVITEICNEMPDCYPIDVTGAGMVDANHWDYEGQKLIATRMIYTMKDNYPFH